MHRLHEALPPSNVKHDSIIVIQSQRMKSHQILGSTPSICFPRPPVAGIPRVRRNGPWNFDDAKVILLNEPAVLTAQVADVLTRHQDDDVCNSTNLFQFQGLGPHAVQKCQPRPTWIPHMCINKCIPATCDPSGTVLHIKAWAILGPVVATLVATYFAFNAGVLNLSCHFGLLQWLPS